MAITRLVSGAILAGIVVLAHFALGKQAEWNGLVKLEDVFVYQNRILPNTDIPIRLPLTGIDAVDNYFAFMVAFFWGTLDARNVRAHLQGNYLIGTLGSIWILMLVEAHRGRRSSAFLFTTYILEFLGELVGIGSFTPIWCTVHLLWTRRPATKNDLAAPNNGLGALGYAILVGHVVPSVLMVHLKPDGEGLASQQLFSIVRLFHPFLVFGAWVVFRIVGGIFTGRQPNTPRTPEKELASARPFYIFSILTSGFFHASSLSVLLAQHLLPGWLKENVVTALDIKTFLIPVPFWQAGASPYSAANPIPFELGVTTFLQWDNICAASAIVVWAASLYFEAGGVRFSTLLQSLLVTVLAGPGAAAAYLLLERDSAALVSVSKGDSGKKIQ